MGARKMKAKLFLITVFLILVSFSDAKNNTDESKCKDPVISKCKCGKREKLQEVYVKSCYAHSNDSCQPCPGACEVFAHCHTCSKKGCATCPIGMTGVFCNHSTAVSEKESLIDTTLLPSENVTGNKVHEQQNVSDSDRATNMSPRTEIDPALDIKKNKSSVLNYRAIHRVPSKSTPIIEYPTDYIFEKDDDLVNTSGTKGELSNSHKKILKEVTNETSTTNVSREEKRSSSSSERADKNMNVNDSINAKSVYSPHLIIEKMPEDMQEYSFFSSLPLQRDSENKFIDMHDPNSAFTLWRGSAPYDSVGQQGLNGHDFVLFTRIGDVPPENSKNKNEKASSSNNEKYPENEHLLLKGNNSMASREFLDGVVKEAVVKAVKNFEGKLSPEIISKLLSIKGKKNKEAARHEKLKAKHSPKKNSTYYVYSHVSALSAEPFPCQSLECVLSKKNSPEHIRKGNKEHNTQTHHQRAPNHKTLRHNGVHYKSPRRDSLHHVHKDAHSGLYHPNAHKENKQNYHHGTNDYYKLQPQTNPNSPNIFYYNLQQPDYTIQTGMWDNRGFYDYAPFESYPPGYSSLYSGYYKILPPAMSPHTSVHPVHISSVKSKPKLMQSSFMDDIRRFYESYYSTGGGNPRAEEIFRGLSLTPGNSSENSHLSQKQITSDQSSGTTPADEMKNTNKIRVIDHKTKVDPSSLLQRNVPKVSMEKDFNSNISKHKLLDEYVIAAHFSDINPSHITSKTQKKCDPTKGNCMNSPQTRNLTNSEKTFKKASYRHKNISEPKLINESGKIRITAGNSNDKIADKKQKASQQSLYYSSLESDVESVEIKSDEESTPNNEKATVENSSEPELDLESQDDYKFWNMNISEDAFSSDSKSDNDHLFRLKRKVSSIDDVMKSKWCPIPVQTYHGDIDCTIWSYKKICTLKCHKGYSGQEGPYKCKADKNKFEPPLKPCKQRG